MPAPAAAAADAAPRAGAEVLRWRPRSPLDLHWRDWGGDSVVYDAADGQTHQFSPLAAAVMAWLEERPLSVAELTAALAAELGAAADDGALRQAVAAAVEQFGQRAWIEASPV